MSLHCSRSMESAATAAGYRRRRVLALSVLFMLVGSSLGFDGDTSSRSGIGGVGTLGLPPETSRRVLHEPLFPLGEPPAPAPAPAPAVPVVEPPPRIPFTNQPFFPLSTPPPPSDLSPAVTGLPANPRQDLGSKGGGSSRKKNVVIGVVVSLCAIVVLWGLMFFLHSRRKRRREEAWVAHNVFLDETPLRGEGAQNSGGGGSENLRVFQAAAPVTAKLAVNGGSDFLYLGTMDPLSNTHLSSNGDRDRDRDRDRDVQSVNDDTHILHNTRNSNFDEKNNDVGGGADNDEKGNAPKFRMPNGGVVDQFQRRRSSPEVHPLPPLAKRPPSHHRTSVGSDSSDDESFYSPKCPSSSSSRSNNDSSSPRMSVCKRLFPPSPPKEQQQPSIVSLKSESTHSYPSSSKTSSPASTPSPLDSPPASSPSPLDSTPSPPITPTVLPPPIRAHLHSNSSSPHHYPPPRRNPPLPPNAETRPPLAPAPIHQFKAPSPPVSHQSKTSTPSPAGHQSNIPSPPPLPPRPLFQFPRISPSTEPKPHPNSFPATPPKENTSFSLPHSSPAREKSNSKSSLCTPLPNRVSPYSSPMREKSVSQSPSSTASSRKSHSSLPPLPTRPTPPFLSSSRSGRQSQSPLPSSNCPPPPPPPDALPPLPSRPSYRPHSGLYSTRMGQPLQSLAPTSDHSPEQQNTPSSDGTPRPKLKPLHWDKVRASPDRAMVWDQLKSGSFKLNEEMIETLFVYNTPTPVKGETTKQSVTPPQNQRLLDSKKSQNIAILLRALSVTKDEVCDALLEGTSDNLSTELLETLSKMAPSKDEEIRLKAYNGDASKLGPAERFLMALLDIPFAFKRIDAMLYRANFKEEINYIRNSFKTLEAACEELRSSRLFLKLLEAVLKTGNRMNVGTIRGDAQAFKLDTLLKLVDVKGTDGKTTLLHFVVQEIIKAEGMRVASTDEQPLTDFTCDTINDKLDAFSTEGKSQKDKEDDYRKVGLQVVAGLSTEMANVKKAAGVDSDALSMSVSKLATGLGKLREILQTDVTRQTKDGNVDGSSKEGNFYRAIESFLEQANEDIRQVQDEEKKAFSRVKEITEYFHGDAAKEEAHPLRFFVVVRDFLSVLDQVCREIGRTQTKNTQGSIRPNPISAPISVPISVPVSSHVFSRPIARGYYDRRPDFDTSSDGSSSP